jgi:hypothetical protein
MALTPEEKKKILAQLDELDREEQKKVLSSQSSFLNWLRVILYAIYLILTQDPDFLKKLFSFIVMTCL